MSALPCGCDPEALWICKQHRPAVRELLADAEPTPTKAPKWERLDLAERFKARLANEDTMRDTMNATPAKQFRAAAVATADAVQTRDDLLNRIALLEDAVKRTTERYGQASHDYRYLLEIERYEREQFRARIAATLQTFYFATLSLSSVQPIIDLAIELNPGIVEQKR